MDCCGRFSVVGGASHLSLCVCTHTALVTSGLQASPSCSILLLLLLPAFPIDTLSRTQGTSTFSSGQCPLRALPQLGFQMSALKDGSFVDLTKGDCF